MEKQENAHYTVFLELEKQIVMDLETRNTFLIGCLEPIITFRTSKLLIERPLFQQNMFSFGNKNLAARDYCIINLMHLFAHSEVKEQLIWTQFPHCFSLIQL